MLKPDFLSIRPERALAGLLLAGLAIGSVFVLIPFLPAIVWSVILAYSTYPVFDWLRVRLRLRRGLAAGVMVVVTAVCLVLPLALLVPGGGNDFLALQSAIEEALAAGLPGPPDWLHHVPVVGPGIAGYWTSWSGDLGVMAAFFRPYFGMMASAGLKLLLGVAGGVLQFGMALVIGFFLWRSGDVLAARLLVLTRRIAGPKADRLLRLVGATVSGTVYGILGTAVVQGFLTAFGLWLSGVPRPALLAVIAGFLSVLPVGAPLIWIPAAIWLLSTGHTAWGVFLGVYGTFAISGADNVIRPYFIARGAQLPFILTILGVLGGAIAFGLLGIFVGPVLLGVGYTLVTEYAAADEELAAATPVALNPPLGAKMNPGLGSSTSRS